MIYSRNILIFPSPYHRRAHLLIHKIILHISTPGGKKKKIRILHLLCGASFWQPDLWDYSFPQAACDWSSAPSTSGLFLKKIFKVGFFFGLSKLALSNTCFRMYSEESDLIIIDPDWVIWWVEKRGRILFLKTIMRLHMIVVFRFARWSCMVLYSSCLFFNSQKKLTPNSLC